MFDNYKHDDFDVVRTDDRYGGFEELKLKNQNQNVRHLLSMLALTLAEGGLVCSILVSFARVSLQKTSKLSTTCTFKLLLGILVSSHAEICMCTGWNYRRRS